MNEGKEPKPPLRGEIALSCRRAVEKKQASKSGEPVSDRDEEGFDPDPALSGVVSGLVASYESHGGINHIEGPNLPSREAVIGIVEDLGRLLFPGFYDKPPNARNVQYVVGALCSTLFDRLSREIEKSLRYECRTAGQCARTEGECTYEACNITLRFLEALPSIRAILKDDVRAHFMGDPAAKSLSDVLVSYPGIHAIAVFRLAHFLHDSQVPLIPRMMTELLHGQTGIDIHPGATIGPGICIDHGTGVVIGETTHIGHNVKIYQGVTLGALSVVKRDLAPWEVDKRHPTIEDDVTIYAGATILGGETTVGRGSVIGGNVWLTRSVPAGTTVSVEAPFQVFRTRKDAGEFETKREQCDAYVPNWEI